MKDETSIKKALNIDYSPVGDDGKYYKLWNGMIVRTETLKQGLWIDGQWVQLP